MSGKFRCYALLIIIKTIISRGTADCVINIVISSRGACRNIVYGCMKLYLRGRTRLSDLHLSIYFP
jgi:hypothetical protein